MKKNRTMRVAALLLALTLVTSCFVGGTFAKYTTRSTGESAARVAYWGFQTTNTMELNPLFSNSYLKNGSDSANSVKANDDTTLLIAPGTEGSVEFKFAYDETAKSAPEVAYTFTVDASESEIAVKLDDELVWSLDGNEVGKFGDLAIAIQNLSGSTDGSGTMTYQPGELPDAFGIDDDPHTISWKWAFSENSDGDTADTFLGNEEVLAEVKLVISITATQID